MAVIAGYLNWRGAPLSGRGSAMLRAQARFGHFDQTVWAEDSFSLAAGQSCASNDPQPDALPIVSHSGRYVLTADLRIDNREELLRRLSLDLVAISDARLLLVAIDRFGPGFLDELIGDFAVGLWDRRDRSLHLARDLLGQRPLCYYNCPSFFAFASRPQGLWALPEIERRPNPDRIAQLVGLVPIDGPELFYAGLYRVEPGHILTVSDDQVRDRRFWLPNMDVLRLPRFDDYRDAFRAQMDQAVRSRLRGAGELIATHLSSGWDSSAVTATAARESGAGMSVAAFTAVPRQGGRFSAPFNRIEDEGEIAAATAALHANVKHVRVERPAASPIARLDEQIELLAQPPRNLCNQVWMDAIRDEASARGARVLLTGQFGNWTISNAPYTILADLLRQGHYRAWWREARAIAKSGAARYRGIAANSFGPWMPDLAWRLVRPLSSRSEASVYSALAPAWAARMTALREARGVGLARRPNDNVAVRVRALRFYDFGDSRAAAMAGWGVDERDPTADRRLIEFCLSLPLDMLLKGGQRRPLARAALADRLPPAVLDERRKGYQAADWHEGMTAHISDIRDLIEQIAQDPLAASLLDIASLRQWVRAWPNEGWDRPDVMARYRAALLGALSAGAFILHASR
jgi:asparagine synthase (glutamine-hydrolysing)